MQKKYVNCTLKTIYFKSPHVVFNKNKIIKFQTVHIELTNNNKKLLLRNQSKFIIFEANKMFLKIKFSVYLN